MSRRTDIFCDVCGSPTSDPFAFALVPGKQVFDVCPSCQETTTVTQLRIILVTKAADARVEPAQP